MLIHPDRWNSLRGRYEQEKPRKMLALDGGGIRGLVTLGILEKIEMLVKQKTGQKLGEYFDYIAGTSTGAIIAAGLSRGKTVGELIDFYTSDGQQMFDPSWLIERIKYLYSADPLKATLQQVFGHDTDLGPANLECLLLVITKNVTTDSAWPISSNPDAKYNDPARRDCNLRIPLWQLVRASTAAPVYFPPEVLQWDPADPSKEKERDIKGEDNLLLISVGTGAAESLGATAASPNKNIVSTAAGLPGELMYGILMDQDLSCRSVGRCTFGAHLDREVLDLVPRQIREGMTMEEQYAAPTVPLSDNLGRNFLYARYNADLSATGLKNLELPQVNAASIQKMDAVENISALLQVGRAAAARVEAGHFGSFL